MAARIAGCDPIIAFDPLPSRLVLARELGITREDFSEIFASL
jgi:threonine dehydrogenase-like Zn-dependent dehydrogenase